MKAESVIATDPPYYDNIGYADLSDFFYVWACGRCYEMITISKVCSPAS